jgi:hypothetical protein
VWLAWKGSGQKIPVGIVSGCVTHSSRWSTARLAIGRTTRVQTCHLTIWMSEPHMFGNKSRSVRTFHTENMKLEENLQKNNIFPKNSFRTNMYNQLIK